jgi:hypothetical protein
MEYFRRTHPRSHPDGFPDRVLLGLPPRAHLGIRMSYEDGEIEGESEDDEV